jgi:hypothetical protein
MAYLTNLSGSLLITPGPVEGIVALLTDALRGAPVHWRPTDRGVELQFAGTAWAGELDMQLAGFAEELGRRGHMLVGQVRGEGQSWDDVWLLEVTPAEREASGRIRHVVGLRSARLCFEEVPTIVTPDRGVLS